MTKKIWFFGLILGLFVGVTGVAKADDSLPSAGDPFWDVMSQLNRPDDSTCYAKTKALLDSLNLGYNTSDRATATCAGVAQIMNMQTNLSNNGITTNLFDQTNWHHVSGLYFEKTDQGRIEFTKEIDFMSRDFMVFIETFGQRMDMQVDEISLDADLVESLRTAGAILTMKKVSNFSDPEILVDNATDIGGVVSGLVYDSVNKTIVFNAAHFTSFKAVEKGSTTSSKKPKITDVEFRKYISDGKEKVKVEISGKKFNKKAIIQLGHQKAEKITWKNSQKIEATFTTKKVLKGNYRNPVTLKVTNPGDKSKKYSERVDLDEIILTKK